MLALHSITKQYDGRTILEAVDLSLQAGDRVGLIGANGAGKSTLLQIAAGFVQPDSGLVTAEGEVTGYLPQQLTADRLSVEEYLAAQAPWPSESYRFDIVLAEVGLAADLKSQLVGELSGGQKTRVGLAALLLRRPTILLLDEPSNNLDTASLNWLGGFIRQFNGAVLMALHDRHMLDELVTEIVELADGRLTSYGGNYSFYLDQKAGERAAQEVHYRHYQTEQKRLKKAIIQKRAMAEKAAKAGAPDNEKGITNYLQDKVSRLYHKDAKTMAKRLERLPEVKRPALERAYSVTIPGQTAAQKLIVAAEAVGFAYGNRPVLREVSFEVRGRERLGVLGANGAGKTTLLKLVAGQLAPSWGRIVLGQEVTVGYYSQELSSFTAHIGIDYLRQSGTSVQACYDMALSLRLAAGDLRRPISQLSYGAQAKLRFARLLLQPLDLLVLDEPTNHLEIGVRHDIETGLQQYGGAIIVASHDEYFLESLELTHKLMLDLDR